MLNNSRDIHTKYKFAPLPKEGAFFFPTDEGCYYTVEIAEAGYKLWRSDLLNGDDRVFELSFDKTCDESNPGFDEAITNTIIHIFWTNIASKGDTCVYYHICEPNRDDLLLYTYWYDDFERLNPDFEAYDFVATDSETAETYYTSLFIHKDNPDKALILSEFEKSISRD